MAVAPAASTNSALQAYLQARYPPASHAAAAGDPAQWTDEKLVGEFLEQLGVIVKVTGTMLFPRSSSH